MIRLHVVAEGQTEEAFVNSVLQPALADHGVIVTAHQITTSHSRGRIYRGGFLQYAHLRKDLALWMRQDQNRDARFTTMVDLYRIPPDFPGARTATGVRDPHERVRLLEASLSDDIQDRRFLPYIQVHEFEALLFSEPHFFSVVFPDAAAAIEELTRIAASVSNPEHIDDGQDTSPAKRISGLLPGFAKSVHGPIIAAHIGLPKICGQCPHFNDWYTKILKISLDAPEF